MRGVPIGQLLERFGWLPTSFRHVCRKSIWVHAVSVGEIISILLVSDQILATTSKGYFLFIDYKNGKLLNYTKASKSGFYSSPIIVNDMIYTIDKNFRLLIFN